MFTLLHSRKSKQIRSKHQLSQKQRWKHTKSNPNDLWDWYTNPIKIGFSFFTKGIKPILSKNFNQIQNIQIFKRATLIKDWVPTRINQPRKSKVKK